MSQQPASFRSFFFFFFACLSLLAVPACKGVAFATTCTPKIVYVADGNQPDFVEAGSSVTFSWEVKNTSSSCDAVNYHLGFDESVPKSSTANYGGENHPSFNLLVGQKGFVKAKMVAAPKEVGTKFKVYYDIFKPDGTNLIDLPLGGLYAEFTVIPKVTPPPPQDCTATLNMTEASSVLVFQPPLFGWSPIHPPTAMP